MSPPTTTVANGRFLVTDNLSEQIEVFLPGGVQAGSDPRQ